MEGNAGAATALGDTFLQQHLEDFAPSFPEKAGGALRREPEGLLQWEGKPEKCHHSVTRTPTSGEHSAVYKALSQT